MTKDSLQAHVFSFAVAPAAKGRRKFSPPPVDSTTLMMIASRLGKIEFNCFYVMDKLAAFGEIPLDFAKAKARNVRRASGLAWRAGLH